MIIEPYRYTTIGNYSTSYTIDATVAIQIYPTFSYPECPSQKGPDPIPSTIDIGSRLYDNNNLLLKSLPACLIRGGDT